MKTLTKKQKEANGENFSRIVDDAAILLQRKADYVMNKNRSLTILVYLWTQSASDVNGDNSPFIEVPVGCTLAGWRLTIQFLTVNC